MMRGVRAARPLAALACVLAAAMAYGQDERRVRVLPERPESGSDFVIEAFLPGERAEFLEAPEPIVRGPAVYTGSDVRPGQGADASAVIAFRFTVTGVGRIDVVGLSARSGGRLLSLGSWSVEAVEGAVAPRARFGSWKAPGSVFSRQAFVATALGPDGAPAECPTFSVEGALVERAPGVTGTFYVVALEPGAVRLPGLGASDAAGEFRIEPSSIPARPLPAGASGVNAVGGPWRAVAVEPETGLVASPGEVVSWDLSAEGQGWPGLAYPPSASVELPDGTIEPLGEGFEYSRRIGGGPSCVSGRKGAFTVQGPGVYVIRPEPFRWFDTGSGTVRTISAPAVRVRVDAVVEPAWSVPASVADFARVRLAEIARADASWSGAAGYADGSRWADALDAALGAAGIGSARGSLAATPIAGPLASKKAAALGALAMLCQAPDPGAADLRAADLRAEDLRAEAYALFLRIEASAFPVRGVAALSEAASASFGNLPRRSYVLPSFGPLGIAAASCAVSAVALFALAGLYSGKERLRGVARRGAALFAVAGALALGLAVASFAERSRPRFVSLGGVSRVVPSGLSAEGEAIAAGRTGVVLRSVGPWLFVELDEGRAVWLAAADAALY